MMEIFVLTHGNDSIRKSPFYSYHIPEMFNIKKRNVLTFNWLVGMLNTLHV